MSDVSAGIILSNLHISAAANNQQPGVNILISLGSSGSSDGSGGSVLVSSGPVTSAPSPCSQGTYVALGPVQAISGMQVQLISINSLPTPGWAGIKLNGTEYDIDVGKTMTTPLGDLTLYALKDLGACFSLPGYVPPGPPTVVPPVGVIPPLPVLDACVLPELSWNFIEVVRQAIVYIACNLNNLIIQVNWLISALAALIPQLLAGIAYFLSLKWITNWIQAFFAQLDIWISAKFGIDPNLPFLDELMKKIMTWFFSILDDRVKDEPPYGKW
jgi:hypothetical protein